MDESKLLETVKELRVESLSHGFSLEYTVVSGSMKLLIRPGDKVSVRKAVPGSLAVGDIVLWKTGASLKDRPIVHRVLWKKRKEGRCLILTKGDWNLQPDARWLGPEDIIGKIVAVHKRGLSRRIDVERAFGRAISLLSCFVSCFASIAVHCLDKIRAVFRAIGPEGGFSFSPDALLFAASAELDPAVWQKTIESTVSMIPVKEGGQSFIGELQFAGGFSEEAFQLIRNGVAVQGISLLGPEEVSRTFDGIIAVRCINLLPHREERLSLYRKAYESLKPDGFLCLSWVNPVENRNQKALSLKRKIWSSLLGRCYKGPAAGATVIDSKFIRNTMTGRAIADEAREHNFRIVKYQEGGRWGAVLLIKQ